MSDCFGWKLPAVALGRTDILRANALSTRLFNNGPNQKIHSIGRCAGCSRVGYTTLDGHPFRHKGPERAPQRLETVSYPHPGRGGREHPGDGRIIWPRGPYEITLRSSESIRVPVLPCPTTTASNWTMRVEYQLDTNTIGEISMAFPTQDLWQFWVDTTPVVGTNNTLTLTLPDLAWNTWTNTYSSTSAYTLLPEGVWSGFLRDPQPHFRTAPRPPAETEEQIRARLQAEQERRLRAERREEDYRRMIEQRRAAAKVAEQTLLSLLTKEQIEEYRKSRSFVVAGSRGSHFRIKHGTSGNVVRLDDRGDEIAGFCAHPQLTIFGDNREALGWLPTEDVMLHQMLALSSDEGGFLAVANRHW